MELADPREGASVVCASCHDQNHRADDVLKPGETSFWTTTGQFPHVLVIELSKAGTIQAVETVTSNVRTLSVETAGPSTSNWSALFETELDDIDGRLQVHSHLTSAHKSAAFVRISILKGWGEHSTVNRVSVRGKAG
ncbi:unnamed protein product [Phaeothamnion confervicola]